MTDEIIKKAGFTLAGFYGAVYALKSATVELDNFVAKEFGFWWPLMDNRLLYGLDAYREATNAPVIISPVKGAIGRLGSDHKGSQHYALLRGVTGIDVLIPEGRTLAQEYNTVRNLEVFSGLGVYPHWSPRPGLHLDVRPDHTPDNPATWSGMQAQIVGRPGSKGKTKGQDYYSVDEALEYA